MNMFLRIIMTIVGKSAFEGWCRQKRHGFVDGTWRVDRVSAILHIAAQAILKSQMQELQSDGEWPVPSVKNHYSMILHDLPNRGSCICERCEGSRAQGTEMSILTQIRAFLGSTSEFRTQMCTSVFETWSIQKELLTCSKNRPKLNFCLPNLNFSGYSVIFRTSLKYAVTFGRKVLSCVDRFLAILFTSEFVKFNFVVESDVAGIGGDVS